MCLEFQSQTLRLEWIEFRIQSPFPHLAFPFSLSGDLTKSMDDSGPVRGILKADDI